MIILFSELKFLYTLSVDNVCEAEKHFFFNVCLIVMYVLSF